MSKHDTLQRLYQIGGAELALRYNDMTTNTSSNTRDDYQLIITNLRFYNGDTNALSESEHQFETRFSQNIAKYIYFQLDMINPWKYTTYRYDLVARYFYPDDSLMTEIKNSINTNPEWHNFFHSDGWGWEEAGNWTPGTYRVEVFIDGQLRLTKTFTIYKEDTKKQTSWPTSFSMTDPLSKSLKRSHLDSPFFLKPNDKPNLFMSNKKDEELLPQGLGLGLAGWMDRLNQQFPATSETDNKTPADDLGKMRWLSALDRRYMSASLLTPQGSKSKKIVQELQEIADDYQVLLNAPMPEKTFVYTKADLQSKLANTYSAMAQACESLHDYEQAKQHYASAIKIFKILGEQSHVQRYQTSLDRLDFAQHGNVDKEILRLRQQLAKVQKDSVEYADILIDLGGINRQNGDDFEAEKLLLQAEKLLDKLSGDISGQDIATALTNSLLALHHDKLKGKPTEIETVLKINGLYRILSVGLSRIYEKTNPQKAAIYRTKAAQRDSSATNNAFSKQMLGSVDDLLKKLE